MTTLKTPKLNSFLITCFMNQEVQSSLRVRLEKRRVVDRWNGVFNSTFDKNPHAQCPTYKALERHKRVCALIEGSPQKFWAETRQLVFQITRSRLLLSFGPKRVKSLTEEKGNLLYHITVTDYQTPAPSPSSFIYGQGVDKFPRWSAQIQSRASIKLVGEYSANMERSFASLRVRRSGPSG